MSSVNKVIVVGNLGKNPELRRTQGGEAVTDFPLATTEVYTDKQGQRQEQTEWHNIVVWKKQAENCAQYLSKGSKVYIEGKLRTRSWDDNGQKRYRTEVIASNVVFLEPKPVGSQQQQNSGFGQPAQGYNQNNGFGQPQPQQQQSMQQHQHGLPVEDELPF